VQFTLVLPLGLIQKARHNDSSYEKGEPPLGGVGVTVGWKLTETATMRGNKLESQVSLPEQAGWQSAKPKRLV